MSNQSYKQERKTFAGGQHLTRDRRDEEEESEQDKATGSLAVTAPPAPAAEQQSEPAVSQQQAQKPKPDKGFLVGARLDHDDHEQYQANTLRFAADQLKDKVTTQQIVAALLIHYLVDGGPQEHAELVRIIGSYRERKSRRDLERRIAQ